MAINAVKLGSELVMVLEDGTYSNGAPRYKSRSFKSVKPSAADTNLYHTAEVLAGLQARNLNAIQRRDLTVLENE